MGEQITMEKIQFNFEKIHTEINRIQQSPTNAILNYQKCNLTSYIYRASDVAPNNHIVQKLIADYLDIKK